MNVTTVMKSAMLMVFVMVASGCAELNPNTAGHIQTALDAKNTQFQQCYEDALKRDRDIKGTVHLEVKFNPDATVPKSVSVAKTKIKDKKLMTCVTKAAQTIEIPETPDAYVDGKYVIAFEYK